MKKKPLSQAFAVLLQYPSTNGEIHDYFQLTKDFKSYGGMVIVAADLLSLALLKPPGEWGADVVIGSSQRFGVPLGFGGPHVAFLLRGTNISVLYLVVLSGFRKMRTAILPYD